MLSPILVFVKNVWQRLLPVSEGSGEDVADVTFLSASEVEKPCLFVGKLSANEGETMSKVLLKFGDPKHDVRGLRNLSGGRRISC